MNVGFGTGGNHEIGKRLMSWQIPLDGHVVSLVLFAKGRFSPPGLVCRDDPASRAYGHARKLYARLNVLPHLPFGLRPG